MDPGSGYSKGYAFMNMRSKVEVFALFEKLDGRKWRMHPSKKRCKVSYARVQAGTPEYDFVQRSAASHERTNGERQVEMEARSSPPSHSLTRLLRRPLHFGLSCIEVARHLCLLLTVVVGAIMPMCLLVQEARRRHGPPDGDRIVPRMHQQPLVPRGPYASHNNPPYPINKFDHIPTGAYGGPPMRGGYDVNRGGMAGGGSPSAPGARAPAAHATGHGRTAGGGGGSGGHGYGHASSHASPGRQEGSSSRGKKVRKGGGGSPEGGASKGKPKAAKKGVRPPRKPATPPRPPMPDVQDETAFPSLRAAATKNGK